MNDDGELVETQPVAESTDRFEKLRSLLDNTTILAILRRVEERLAKAESSPSLNLSADKNSFPKLLCLDQQAWIGLAKAHHKRHDGESARPALDAVRAARARGSLVVPMMDINVTEAAEPKDEARRKRLASFMVDLSGNLSVLNPVAWRTVETERAIKVHFLNQPNAPSVRPALIHWGASAAATGHDARVSINDKFMETLVNQALNEPEFSVAYLVHAVDRETVERLRSLDKDGVKRIDRTRAVDGNKTAEQRRPREMLHLLAAGSYADQFHATLARLGISPEVFADCLRDEEHLLALTREIPEVDIQATMVYARDRNPNEETEANDFKDMSFLCQAIPYANIVVTEKLWTHLANRSGVATKYATTVIASLGDLPDVLRTAGCL